MLYRPVPSGNIQTNKAIAELTEADEGWQKRLNIQAKAKASSKARIQRSSGSRLEAIYARIRQAVVSRELVPRAWVSTHGQWYDLPESYWEGANIDETLWTGLVVETSSSLTSRARKMLRDAEVCFLVPELKAWVANDCTADSYPLPAKRTNLRSEVAEVSATVSAHKQLAASSHTAAQTERRVKLTEGDNRRGAPSRAALKNAFLKWVPDELDRRGIVTERAARKAMEKAFPGHHVGRQSVRDLIKLVPAKKRAPRNRPKGG
jgi:hypothetical protein